MAPRDRAAAPRASMPTLACLLLALLLAAAAPAAAGAAHVPEERSIASVRGCELRYHVYRPAEPVSAPVVLIGHGFMRDGGHMRGWADAFAAAGLTAVTLDFCASSAADGRHADNGADLVAVRRALGADEAIYVGVSAGGLAALIAASSDGPATRGLLLLDPTNAGGQARRAAGRVQAPVAALVAGSQVCNAWRNIDRALATLADATILEIGEASHCDFEWPSDTFCRVACLATTSDAERARAQARIRDVAIGFVRALSDASPHAVAGWKASLGGHSR